jgi:hypothetical protein
LLGIEELLELEEAIREELNDNLTGILTKLNRADRLEELLSLLGLESLLEKDAGYQVYKTGKIVAFGQSDVTAEVLLAIGKKLGIDKNRFEFYLEYEDAKKFNFKKMQWQPSYSVVLVGPMPHSGVSKGDAGSIISAIETEEGYPPVIRLGRNSLKITKTDFKEKLQELIELGTVA